MTPVLFDRSQRREAKEFLKDAVILSKYSDPCVVNTTYEKDGEIYFEHDSRLEYPEDSYYVSKWKGGSQ